MKSDFLAKIRLKRNLMGIYKVLWFCSSAIVLSCTVCPKLHLSLTSQFSAILALFSPECVLALNVWLINILSAHLLASPEGLSVLTRFLQLLCDLTPLGALCVVACCIAALRTELSSSMCCYKDSHCLSCCTCPVSTGKCYKSYSLKFICIIGA